MARDGLLTLPPAPVDLWLARRMERAARAPVEHEAQVITWAADEKLLLAVIGAAWLGIRLLDQDRRRQRRADHLMLANLAAAAVPHVAKWLVQRERPDRCVVAPPRHGIPRSGKPYDSFPSGHAVHVGAIAAALSRWVPKPWRLLVWIAAGGLAATRLVLLAHWLTDVAAGLAIGGGLEAALHRLQYWQGGPSPATRRVG